MKNRKASFLAWTLCGVVTASVLLQMAVILANPRTNYTTLALSEDVFWGLLTGIFVVVAALIVSRQPRNVIGWLLMCPAIVMAIPADTYIGSFTTAPAEPTPLLLLGLWFAGWGWVLLLFPTGRPPSARWRWLIVAGLGMCAAFLFFATFSAELGPITGDLEGAWIVPNPIGFIQGDAFPMLLWSILLGILTVACAASVVVRFRRAPTVERAQMKWLLYACAAFAAVYLPGVVRGGAEGDSPLDIALMILFPISLMTIPIAIAVAILRYRLWDIDVIINRTLVYGALTGTLALLYLLGVGLLGGFFRSLTGQGDQLAIVVTTLALAAIFTPLRRRVQAGIDRRFYRNRYDAERTLSAFSGTVQDEMELEEVSQTLLGLVTDTVHPEHTSLWLRDVHEAAPDAS
mgnify:CR=1 FL=1